MKNVIFCLIFFSSLFYVSCLQQSNNANKKIVDEAVVVHKNPFQQLCQYWEVTDADNPTKADVFNNNEDGIYNYAGIVFMTDSTFLENPRGVMRYGKFVFKGKTVIAQFDDNAKAIYTIESRQGDTTVMKRLENNHTTTLYLKGFQDYWADAKVNPYNKINSVWRIKPSKAETDDELKARLKNCVQFYQYFFEGTAESPKKEIDFLGLPTCFKWYSGAIYVLSEKNLDKKWINCFYNGDQAKKARQIMEDLVTGNKYNWDTTQTNWVKQTADVLKQIKAKM